MIFILKVLEQVGLNADTNCSSTTIMSLGGSSVTGFKLQNELVSFLIIFFLIQTFKNF
jgi:hypothetical protein